MAQLTVVGSSSRGNGYILEGEKETLILECGLPIKKVENYCDYNIKNWAGVLLSHVHTDHSRCVKDYISHGLKVYSCNEVHSKYANVKALRAKSRYRIGAEFIVQPIALKHNAENFGYIIDFDGIRVVFATDCMDFPYKIPHVNVWMIEMNNSEDVVAENFLNGDDLRSQYQNHLSVEKAIMAVKRNYSTDLQKVIGIHLSDTNSDKDLFSKKFFAKLGILPIFAEEGLTVELNNSEF